MSETVKTDESLIEVPETMIFWAFRYCINRSSYAVGDCVDSLIKCWDKLPDTTKERIKKEINEKLNKDIEYMDKCDIDSWKVILDLKI